MGQARGWQGVGKELARSRQGVGKGLASPSKSFCLVVAWVRVSNPCAGTALRCGQDPDPAANPLCFPSVSPSVWVLIFFARKKLIDNVWIVCGRYTTQQTTLQLFCKT